MGTEKGWGDCSSALTEQLHPFLSPPQIVVANLHEPHNLAFKDPAAGEPCSFPSPLNQPALAGVVSS